MSLEPDPDAETPDCGELASRPPPVPTTALLSDDGVDNAVAGRAAAALRRLEAEPSHFLLASRPATAAIMLAATKTIAELEASENSVDRPALVALAEKAVLAAVRGSAAHLSIVTERIEGKAGLRSGDTVFGPTTPGAGYEIGEAIESAIAAMTNARLATPDAPMPPCEDPSSERKSAVLRDGRVEEFAGAPPVTPGEVLLDEEAAAGGGPQGSKGRP